MDYDSYRRPITLGLIIPVVILSLSCTFLILGYFLTHSHVMLRKSLHHHAVFLLTIVSLLYTAFDLPFSMNYFRQGFHPYRSIPFCLWWYWFDYSLVSMSLYLTATASIQRHILVFHSHLLQVRTKRIVLHYLPLAISVLYPPSFYIGFMFIYQCQLYYVESDGWCAYPCYMDDAFLYQLDWILSTVVPVGLILLANVTLVLRVMHMMRRVRRQQNDNWRRQRKLTLQLFAFTSLYLAVYVSTTTVAILHITVLPDLYNDVPNIYYIYHLIYFVCPLQSIFCIFALPELLAFLRRKLRRPMMVGTMTAPSLQVRSLT